MFQVKVDPCLLLLGKTLFANTFLNGFSQMIGFLFTVYRTVVDFELGLSFFSPVTADENTDF